MTTARIAIAAATVVATTALGACTAQLTPSSLTEVDETTWVLEMDCGDPNDPLVDEGFEEIRIRNIRGRRIDGDCLGHVTIELERPLAHRAFVVNGETWIRIDDNCRHRRFAPTAARDEWAWRLPTPCEFLDR